MILHALIWALGSVAHAASPRACNNSPALCSRAYDQTTFMGAHDSAFLRDASTHNSLAGNQYKNATMALDAGLRLLQAQVHLVSGGLRLCHTSCDLLDAGPLDAWLTRVQDWMAGNTQDVVTLLLVNSDKVEGSAFETALNASGLGALATRAPTQWPTLGEMIDRGTRAVVFVTDVQASESWPHILPEFDYVFETPFEVTALDGFNCTVDRPRGASPSKFMGLVNHFKDTSLAPGVLVPDVDALATVNSEGSLGAHVRSCMGEWGRRPSFALVDFWDVGDVVKVGDGVNGLNATSGRTGNATLSTGTSGGTRRGVSLGAFAVFLAVAAIGF